MENDESEELKEFEKFMEDPMMKVEWLGALVDGLRDQAKTPKNSTLMATYVEQLEELAFQTEDCLVSALATEMLEALRLGD